MSEKEKTQVEQEPTQQGGWRFYPIAIVAPKQIMEQVIYPQLEADAKDGKGLFKNVTTTPMEDVSEDDFAMVEVYDCKASFTKYFDELKQFGVMARGNTDAFLSGTMKHLLLVLLKDLALYVEAHTDTPAQTKNYILEKVVMLDKMPIWGLFLQILVLQGLCRWIESVTFDEGDKGFNEAQSFYEWLFGVLVEKVASFCCGFYGDNDKERLKPLCAYLYTTEAGKLVQQTYFGNVEPTAEALNQPEGTDEPASNENTLKTQKKALPPELDKPEAKALLQKVIGAGYCDENYYWYGGWHYGRKDMSRLALAYFAYRATQYLKLKTKTYNRTEKTGEITEVRGASWVVFEDLFTYDGQVWQVGEKNQKSKLKECFSNYLVKHYGGIEAIPDHIKKGVERLFEVA